MGIRTYNATQGLVNRVSLIEMICYKGGVMNRNANVTIVLFFLLLSISAWAANLTVKELTGAWEFMYWAQADDLDNKHEVGIVMDFRPDGTVISRKSSGDVSEHYKVEGNTIIYTGKRGDQLWKVISFSPGKSFLVNNLGTIMSFEKI